MNDEQIFELADKSSFQDDSGCWIFKDEGLLDFVFMVQKAEREKVAKWMTDHGYATGHGDTIEDLFKELEWQVAEREREACAKLCDDKVDAEYATGKVDHNEMGWTQACAQAIRSRGIDGAKVGEVGVWGEK